MAPPMRTAMPVRPAATSAERVKARRLLICYPSCWSSSLAPPRLQPGGASSCLEWAGRLLLKGFDQVSGSRLKRGPEDEPIGLVKESLRWHGLFGRFGDSERDWWAGLADVRVPLLAAAGAGDTQDPAWACRKLFEQFGSAQKEYHCLGKADGFSQDYGHVDMLVSKGAQKEVWPLLAAWLLRAGKA